jgi:DNA-binding MarR family transcriptional regulator
MINPNVLDWIESFQVYTETRKALEAKAKQLGYKHFKVYLRALLEDAAGERVTTPIRGPAYSKSQGEVLERLDTPKSIWEISDETGRKYNTIVTNVKWLERRGFIKEVRESYTGGRPAKIYVITEKGQMLLKAERERLEKVQAESAKNTDAYGKALKPGRPRNLYVTDTKSLEGQAGVLLLDKLYKEEDLSEEQIGKEFEEQMTLWSDLVRDDYDTWERIIEGLGGVPKPVTKNTTDRPETGQATPTQTSNDE